ncbi:MAG: FlgD immunoglobulin-like domain containing protein [bacterium]
MPDGGDAAGGRGARLWCDGPHGGGVRLGLDLPRPGAATVIIYDVRGRRVRQVFAGELAAGVAEITWDGKTAGGSQAASGMYIARLCADGAAATVRVVIAH